MPLRLVRAHQLSSGGGALHFTVHTQVSRGGDFFFNTWWGIYFDDSCYLLACPGKCRWSFSLFYPSVPPLVCAVLVSYTIAHLSFLVLVTSSLCCCPCGWCRRAPGEVRWVFFHLSLGILCSTEITPWIVHGNLIFFPRGFLARLVIWFDPWRS